MKHSVQDLSPAYFALVMATGAVSLAARSLNFKMLAQLLFWFNLIFYAVLLLLTIWRIMMYTSLIYKDFLDYRVAPGFLTLVAGTAILGGQFIILENDRVIAIMLLLLASFSWLLLNYGLFFNFAVQRNKPSFEDSISGSWLLLVVSIQSIAILILLLDAGWASLYRLELNFVSLSLWLLGGMFYIWIITLILLRFIFFGISAKNFEPSYWINMGAMAISALAGSLLIDGIQKYSYLYTLMPFIKSVALLFWVTGTMWIPLLIILFIWRHYICKHSIHYESAYWSMVFPIGMYSLCSLHLAISMNIPFLIFIGKLFFFLSLAVWSITFFGLIHNTSVLMKFIFEYRRRQ